MLISPLFAALSAALIFADIAPPPTTADAAEAIDAAPDADAPEGADESAGADDYSPEILELLAGLDDESRALFLTLDETTTRELFDRAQRGEQLSPAELKVTQALTAAMLKAFDRELNYKFGDVTLSDGLATLHLGEEFRYLGPSDAERVLTEAWGNPPGNVSLGMIVPADISPLDPTKGWGVVITYSEEGHVSDDDADEIDYDELLEQLQEATEEANGGRISAGYEPMHLVGWAEPPRYVGDKHSLYWAQQLAVDGAPQHSLNYAIRVLGRKGVLEFNAVSGIDQLAAIKPEMEAIFARVEFEEGNRYIDFDPDIDEVAAYGLGGLIAGKVALKAGLWAGLLKLLIAGKKFILFIVIGGIAGIKGLLGMRKDKDQNSDQSQDQNPDQSQDQP